MRLALALLALTASAAAQAVTELVVPSAAPPAGCENSRQGTFTITIVNATGATPTRRSWDHLRGRDLEPLLPRQQDGVLTLSLTGGLLTDQAGRTGYVASNYQFQFDKPPQAGAIYTGGFGMCSNGSLSIGGSAVWWQCLSGNFYNLYDRDWAEHCSPVYFVAIGGAGSVYSTSPSIPETTGSDQNTIANGGGTAGNTATGGSGIGVATSTKPASATALATGAAGSVSSRASSASSSASAAASSASSSVNSAASSASSSASAAVSSASSAVSSASASAGAAATSSSSAPAAIVTGAPQAVLAWVAGIIGAVALV